MMGWWLGMERMVSRTLSVHVGLNFPVLMEPTLIIWTLSHCGRRKAMDGIYEMECPMFDTVVAAESARFDWEIVTWLPRAATVF